MIKVDLITGFLGSGKTTFLVKYARHLMKKGLRIGILEYDLGAINVDMLLLNKLRGDRCELEMVAAGCDSDCLNRRFRTKLISMAMSGYDRVIVEPSGVFDMDWFYDAMRDDPLEKWYEIGSVITIVNANLGDEIGGEADFLLASQAACAGTVVLSRTQLSNSENIEKTKAHIARAAETIKCSKFNPRFSKKNWEDFTEEDLDSFMNCGYTISDYVKITAGNETSFSSVCFMDVTDSLESLKNKVSVLFNDDSYGKVMRVKGFIIENGVSYQLNATQYEITAEPIAIGQKTVIVIGTELNEQKITELIMGEVKNGGRD